MADAALSRLAEAAGVHAAYIDLSGHERRASPETQRALLRAIGIDANTPAAIDEALRVLAEETRRAEEQPDEVIIACGQARTLPIRMPGDWHLADADTGAPVAEGPAGATIALPPLPPGLYDLVCSGGTDTRETLIIAAPERAPTVAARCGHSRAWGMTAALYGLRSAGGAIGTYDDLGQLAEIAAGFGAEFVGINPIHAFGIAADDVISPYSPSHRAALNPLHIGPAVPDGTGHAGLIDYARAKTINHADLEARYRRFRTDATAAERDDFASFEAEDPLGIARFAEYEALSEVHGPDWRNWPAALQDAQGAAVREALRDKADRVTFHTWVQWLTDRHIGQAAERARGAGMGLGLYLDLAVGARRGGAESWAEAATVARGVSVGAPPDHLSPAGQNWDLTALSPRKLRARKYGLFRRILRSVLRHAGMIRIDHVLGLARSFWIPDDGSPGGYVTQPLAALSAIVKIEATRAGAVVIGEDLGLVPPGFRENMRAHGLYGYSVLQYEKAGDGAFRDPAGYDPRVLACFGSHDTPTLTGYQTGHDIDWWQKLGWIDAALAPRLRAERARDVTLIRSLAAPGAPDFASAVHQTLARSDVALVSVQLDDILGIAEAQNLPGTIDEHPNWRRRYPVAVADLAGHGGLSSVSACMAQEGRSRLHSNRKEMTHEH